MFFRSQKPYNTSKKCQEEPKSKSTSLNRRTVSLGLFFLIKKIFINEENLAIDYKKRVRIITVIKKVPLQLLVYTTIM